MTNKQIIAEYMETMGIDFDYNGKNLLTFAQWKRQGKSVKKGEKAFIKIKLWTMKEVNEKDENGKVVKDENGKNKKEKKFYLKTSALFKNDQVEELKSNKKQAA